MTAPSPAPVSTADVSKLLKDIHQVACHIATVGDLLTDNDDTSSVGDLIHELGMRILCDLDSYSSQSSN